MDREHETHTLELLSRTDDGLEEWFCPTCGRHMLLSLTPTLAQTLLAEGDARASHSNLVGGAQLEALQPMTVELLHSAEHTRSFGSAGAAIGHVGVDAFVEFGEPEPRDGLEPWIAFLKRLS